ncbi:MAG TPA: DNA repair protein RecO [Methylibium sp.]|uniref:DNA repair protein RecO n=1 Tax=Methylibium sp. TaxID=2067992 RepID=UPI002DBE3F95|nr:DNA repair protein RecO [Methylibium sp.]HEU4458653.1 DNA repair protein RecO [Methylibium sp.]
MKSAQQSALKSTQKAAHEAAYVLHSWDWSESSLIVDLFTRSQGRVVVVAKGAKRPTSQMRAVLLPFQRLVVAFGTRRDKKEAEASEVHTLRHAERAGGGPIPGGEALLSGFYLNELLMKLLAREDPHPALFDAYAAVMPLLGGQGRAFDEAALEITLRSFELLLLREVGLLPELSRVTATQRPLEPAGGYRIDAERGLVEHERDGAALDGRLLVALEEALSNAPAAQRLDAIAAAELRPVAAALKLNLRPLLQYHLGQSALRTRTLMQDLSRLPHHSAKPAR